MLQDIANRFALSHGLVLGALLIVVVFACPGGIAEAMAGVLGPRGRPRTPASGRVGP